VQGREHVVLMMVGRMEVYRGFDIGAEERGEKER
jgi:hypothetical protein